MSDACYCDYDFTWSVYRKAEHTARKEHKCYECGRKIMPGERYESAFGIGDGTAYNMPTCPHCIAIREWVVAHVPCSCWCHGHMLEDTRNEVEAYAGAAEGTGFVMGYLRRLAAMYRAKGLVHFPGSGYMRPERAALMSVKAGTT